MCDIFSWLHPSSWKNDGCYFWVRICEHPVIDSGILRNIFILFSITMKFIFDHMCWILTIFEFFSTLFPIVINLTLWLFSYAWILSVHGLMICSDTRRSDHSVIHRTFQGFFCFWIMSCIISLKSQCIEMVIKFSCCWHR